MLIVFAFAWWLPADSPTVQNALIESFAMLHEYARDHIILCLVPAFFIAGAVGVFVRQASVMKYLGSQANKVLAYGVASVSGTILAVCSCTVLPLFSSIHRRGAGLGPAIAFLYSGPAINVLAIVLTARVLGFELGAARAIGAVSFSVIIGLIMHFVFLKEEKMRAASKPLEISVAARTDRSLWQESIFFATMVGFLVFANWGKGDGFLFEWIYRLKWIAAFSCLVFLLLVLSQWFKRAELKEWCWATWTFAKQITPLLLGGVLIAGFLLGRPGHEGIIPSRWVSDFVGGNSFAANAAASVIGAFMYFATLTEVPIVQGLIGSGMGKGPALALLLAGPALSLPSMLVIRSVLGTKKALAYITLVTVMATLTGMAYGALF
jgi:uncharacterized membrane protein YraQ (UPF0718 family)